MNNVVCSPPFPYTGPRKGFIALLSAVAAGSVALVLTLSLLTIGTVVVQDGLLTERAARARGMADACAEEALQRMREQQSCEASGTVTLVPDTCTYRLAAEGETTCVVEATGTAADSVRHVRASVDLADPASAPVSWRELASF